MEKLPKLNVDKTMIHVFCYKKKIYKKMSLKKPQNVKKY